MFSKYYSIFEKFKNRELKARDIFYIDAINKVDAYEFVKQYHYLSDAKFFSMYNYGLFIKGTIDMVGVATYSAPQGPNSLAGWFSVENDDTSILELSRLCLLPQLNSTNASSYLLGNTLKMLKKLGVRAVITLADASRHVGSVYQVCNFKYYGLTPKRDVFYTLDNKRNPRIVGKKEIRGLWVSMPQKHRYAYVFDPKLKVNHSEQEKPSKSDTLNLHKCIGCNDAHIVLDKRFNEYYTCPLCTSYMLPIEDEFVYKFKNNPSIESVENYIKDKRKNEVELKEEGLW